PAPPEPVHDPRCDVVPFVEARGGRAVDDPAAEGAHWSRVSGIRRGTTLEQLGLRNGDLVVAVRTVGDRCEWDLVNREQASRTLELDPEVVALPRQVPSYESARPVREVAGREGTMVTMNGTYTAEQLALFVGGGRPLESSCGAAMAPLPF